MTENRLWRNGFRWSGGNIEAIEIPATASDNGPGVGRPSLERHDTMDASAHPRRVDA